jgi:hypothetical protein
MKKALVVLLILAVAGGLFAQSAPSLTVQGRLDTWWIPFQYIDNDGDSVMGAGLGRDSNSGVGPRARLFLEGKADNLGLKIQLQFYPTAILTSGSYNIAPIGFDDNVEIWWQPTEWLKLDVGRFVSDPLRGKIGDNWAKAFTAPMANSLGGLTDQNADAIFSRFHSAGIKNGESANGGVLGSFTFGDLFIGVLFPNLLAFGADDGIYETVANPAIGTNIGTGANEFLRTYERTQLAIGYTIADVGLVRAQFVGANATINTTTNALTGPRFEAAFAYTGVEGLTIDVGGKFWLPLNESSVQVWNSTDLKWDDGTALPDGTYSNPVQVALGVIYKTGPVNIIGRVDAQFLGGYEGEPVTGTDVSEKLGPEVGVYLWPTYDVGVVVLGLHAGFRWYGKDETTTTVAGSSSTVTNDEGGIRVGGGLWAQKAWGACSIKGGLFYSAATEFGGVSGAKSKSDGVFSVPIVFEYTF